LIFEVITISPMAVPAILDCTLLRSGFSHEEGRLGKISLSCELLDGNAKVFL
jgi:hypothetical protein